MSRNWDAVADSINTRLDELQMTQNELAIKSGVSTATLRELQHNRNPRRRNARLLEAISTALGWTPSYLSMVADGGPVTSPSEADVTAALDELRTELAALRKRVDRIERRA
jgi:transcriptional regulator with XRE-family HTH domain